VCARCGGDIDLALTERARKRYLADGVTPNPDYMHMMGGTAGHIVSVAELRAMDRLDEANDPANLQPEHRHCNSQHGARMLHRINRERTVKPSRDW
jgi:hypothetical protein